MTAPRWIAEALEDAIGHREPWDEIVDDLTKALHERLPIQQLARALSDNGPRIERLCAIIAALTDDDPEVVTLTELYQGASRMLDAAGVPYERGLTDDGDPQVMRLNLAGRIQWLAQQRPTRLELKRVEAERDAHGAVIRTVDQELCAAGVPLTERRTDLAAGVCWLAQRLAVAEKSREHEAKEANRWAGEARESQLALQRARRTIDALTMAIDEVRAQRRTKVDHLSDQLHAARAKIAALTSERDQVARGAVDAVERLQERTESFARDQSTILELTKERDDARSGIARVFEAVEQGMLTADRATSWPSRPAAEMDATARLAGSYWSWPSSRRRRRGPRR